MALFGLKLQLGLRSKADIHRIFFVPSLPSLPPNQSKITPLDIAESLFARRWTGTRSKKTSLEVPADTREKLGSPARRCRTSWLILPSLGRPVGDGLVGRRGIAADGDALRRRRALVVQVLVRLLRRAGAAF